MGGQEEALIGRSAKAQHRRHQCEGRAASLFVGQIWEDVHDDAVGGVEASVEMGVPGSAEHHVCIVGPRLGKCRKADEILDVLVQAVGVISVVEFSNITFQFHGIDSSVNVPGQTAFAR